MSTLYDDDIVLWAEAQADLLRRLADGERVNAALDFENLIDELESVGRSQITAVGSHLRVVMTHLLLAHGAPHARDVRHWLADVRAAVDNAGAAYAPSMAQRLDLGREWHKARRQAADKLAAMGLAAPSFPENCPFTIAELVADDAEPAALLARLGA